MESPAQLNLVSKTSTFVSIDVVGSTALKSDESDQDIIYTFLSYHKLVKELAYQHHGEVIHITGDGMMCRFERPDDAAGLSRALLLELPNFNKRQNHLSKPLVVRIGVHTGDVYQHEGMAAGQLISKTLDLAAKLQQGAPSNRARFSDATANALTPSRFALRKIGWDVQLQLHVLELSVEGSGKAVNRRLPDPVKVLLVEQELDEMVKLRHVLWTRQYETLPAYTAHQAGLCVTAWQPHVIMSSVDLAWETGWELLDTLRREKSLSQLPILVMSAQSKGQLIERALSKGGNGFLRKPIDEKQVLKRLDLVLREFYL